MEKTLAPKIISRTALTNARPGVLLMEAIQDEAVMTRPKVADDFAAIRARMEELRRERADMLASDRDGHDPAHPVRHSGQEPPRSVRVIPVLERRPRN